MANYAWQFFLISEFVSGIKGDLRGVVPAVPVASGNALAAIGSGRGLGGIGSIFNNIDSSNEWLTDEEQTRIKEILSLLEHVCREIGIKNISPEVDRIRGFLPSRRKSLIVISIEHLSDRVVDELRDREFVHIDAEKMKYYRKQELFGSLVGEKFPKLIEDISSAGTCYALGQNTACVFHLMRVMEHCVQRLGRKLRITLDTKNESWHQIMIHVHKSIEALPGGRKASTHQNNKKNNLAAAASRLDHVRIVWRNDVMHPKETYDESQALEVLTSVEAFLKSVAPLL